MKQVLYILEIGAGRFTARLEMVGHTSRLYRGGDLVAIVKHRLDGSFKPRGNLLDIATLLEMRETVLIGSQHLRN